MLIKTFMQCTILLYLLHAFQMYQNSLNSQNPFTQLLGKYLSLKTPQYIHSLSKNRQHEPVMQITYFHLFMFLWIQFHFNHTFSLLYQMHICITPRPPPPPYSPPPCIYRVQNNHFAFAVVYTIVYATIKMKNAKIKKN